MRQINLVRIPQCLYGHLFTEAALVRPPSWFAFLFILEELTSRLTAMKVIYHFTQGNAMLIGVHGGTMWAHRKQLILNPRPDYRLKLGDLAFVISDRMSTAHMISNLAYEQLETCVKGIACSFFALLANFSTYILKIGVHQVFQQMAEESDGQDSSNSESDSELEEEQGKDPSATAMKDKSVSKGKEIADLLQHIERDSAVQRLHFFPF